jgi:hypothetical protein
MTAVVVRNCCRSQASEPSKPGARQSRQYINNFLSRRPTENGVSNKSQQSG